MERDAQHLSKSHLLRSTITFASNNTRILNA
jgi:hypothetical protein